MLTQMKSIQNEPPVRLPAAGSATADLTMSYAGNRLASVSNGGSEQLGTFSYEYDSNGNMTKHFLKQYPSGNRRPARKRKHPTNHV